MGLWEELFLDRRKAVLIFEIKYWSSRVNIHQICIHCFRHSVACVIGATYRIVINLLLFCLTSAIIFF